MLGGYGSKGRGVMPSLARQRLAAFPRSSRSMSSFRPQAPQFPGRTLISGSAAWKQSASPIPRVSISAARFNSTSAASSAAEPATGGEVLSDAPSNLSDIDITSIPEHIGYLKDLGLDYGWGPSSTIQFLMEHIHMYTGLPWWASIIGTGVLIRLAMLYPTIRSADTSVRLNNIKHISTPLRVKQMHYYNQGNAMEAAKAKAELEKLYKDNGIIPWLAIVPAFIQIPFGFGCYRVIKGMTSLPVPGLLTESVGWLKDLTIADPYFILPVAQSLFMYLSFKRGGEFGNNEMMKSSMGKMMLYGLPAISFLFVSFFPSALQLYFATTGLLGLAQAYVINSVGFRKWAGMALPDKITKTDPSSPFGDQSRALRMLTEALEAERAKMTEAQRLNPQNQDLSFIDRAIESIKQQKDQIRRETTEKISELRGDAPQKNADGSPAAPPRLSEKDIKLADDYEKRRREEEQWQREERNRARREAHLRAMEMEREKARAAFSEAAKMKQR